MTKLPRPGQHGKLPKVSIIIRSVGRPELCDAMAAVAAQTYSSIEVVVVDASGGRHAPVASTCGHFPVVFVGGDSPRTRSAAANAGLDAASGEYLTFLDDDDLITPDHVAGLVAALEETPSYAVAYSFARVIGEDGSVVARRAESYSRLVLFQGCFLPIHAAMFGRGLLSHCRFDETLNLAEDWDFWLQAAAVTDFLAVPQETAIYRCTLGSSGMDTPAGESRGDAFLRDRARVVDKWRAEHERQLLELENDFADAAELFAGGNQEAALTAAEAILRRYPYHVESLVLVGTVQALRGNFECAARHFRRAVRESPDEASAHFNLAQALERLDHREEAQNHYRRAAELQRQGIRGAALQ